MELKNFKTGDTVVQKNNNNIKWKILKIDQDNNSVYLQRKGGYFNEMITQFNGDNINFEAASRTEQRIKRENRIIERQKKQENFQQNKKKLWKQLTNALEIHNEPINNLIKPKEISEIANCTIKEVLNAIHNKKIPTINNINNNEKPQRGVRYLINYKDAIRWINEYKKK